MLASATPTLIALTVTWLAGGDVDTTGLVGLAASIMVMSAVAGRSAWRSGASTLGIAAAAATALVVGALLVAVKVALK